MKKLCSIIFATSLLFFVSCNKDDISEEQVGKNNDDTSEEPVGGENQENKAVELLKLESSIKIGALTTIKGMPPSPSGAVNFKINTDKQEGYQKNGFNIAFSSTNTIAGAYILFQDMSGNKAQGYFDVPKTAFEKTFRKKSVFRKDISEEVSNTINVDFLNDFPPGEFCYEICLYDTENNVSEIEKICVKIEAWGGNSNITGKWIFDRYLEDEVKEEITCENGEVLMVDYEQYSKEELLFTLNESGTYMLTNHEVYKSLDYQATVNSCTAIYESEDEEYNIKSTGNWAYNDDENTIAIVEFEMEDLIDSNDSETHPYGEVLLDKAVVKVINNELHIIETYSDGLTYTIVFKKG